MDHGNTQSPGATDALSTASVCGAPCWVSLTSHDLEAAQRFYGAVLGWRWRPATVGEHFRIALADTVPVAGIAVLPALRQTGVAWTPYFAVPDADVAAARARERGGTAGVGPLRLPPGRAALLSDRHGATFGIWEGELFGRWDAWRRAAPTVLTLHTRDAFDAALFYGGVLDWASGRPGSCEVEYEADEVLLRSQGLVVARVESGESDTAPDPSVRPHWQVTFLVADVPGCARAAERHGGSVLEEGAHEAVLRDPDGARFTVASTTGLPQAG
ncbi:VOC family protein [Streptomyces sp. NPDC038707]|uniref:VOC family protein n=1 Tax=Streptomyces sp. NPDC038707 TaxID=3154329 RepID=UPI0033DF5F1D